MTPSKSILALLLDPRSVFVLLKSALRHNSVSFAEFSERQRMSVCMKRFFHERDTKNARYATRTC